MLKRALRIAAALAIVLGLSVGLLWMHLNRVRSERIEDIPFATAINEQGERETLHLDVYLRSEPGPGASWARRRASNARQALSYRS